MPAAELHEQLFLRADGVICDVDADEYSDPSPVNDRYETVQFTGLLDCEGEEIYGGDILSLREEPNDNGDSVTLYLVKFLDGAFWGINLDNESDTELLLELNSFCEIVDNILGSPELLEAK